MREELKELYYTKMRSNLEKDNENYRRYRNLFRSKLNENRKHRYDIQLVSSDKRVMNKTLWKIINNERGTSKSQDERPIPPFSNLC